MIDHPGSPPRHLHVRDLLRLAAFSILTALVTLVVSALPRFEVVESAMNDENFTDLVLQTRGEAPIDTSLFILTYNRSLFDNNDRVDRGLLAMRLAAVLELKPLAVGVDFLIEDRRPEAPDGDEMLKGLIASNSNLVFGIFHEDSLRRFRVPPPWFEIPDAQLGCINLQEDKDRTIRTFTRIWGDDGKKQYESFDVNLSRRIDPAAVRNLLRYSQKTFVIDFASGIGEVVRDPDETGATHIFPVLPIDSVFNGVMSGDSTKRAVYASLLRGRCVLVGYGDLRQGQVTSIVDRFYTPLKPEKNALPDMHGVAIHANIINTILKRRIMEVMPTWANLVWGSLIVFALLTWREWLKRLRRPTARAILFYAAFAALFVLGAFVPILLFRYTAFKFSIYTPLAGLLLSVATAEAATKAMGLMKDIRRRRRLRDPIPAQLRPRVRAILVPWSSDKRLEQGIHFIQMEYHRLCSVLFVEALSVPLFAFPESTIAAPTLPRMLSALHLIDRDALPLGSRRSIACDLLARMTEDVALRDALELSRSLYIAINEIRRQTVAVAATSDTSRVPDEAMAVAASYADLALRTLSGSEEGDDGERFEKLYEAIERWAVDAGTILHSHGWTEYIDTSDLMPYAIRSECRLHHVEEEFIYLGTQEDANNRDDYFDLVYGGSTIRCQPREHPGLSEFRYLTEHRTGMMDSGGEASS